MRAFGFSPFGSVPDGPQSEKDIWLALALLAGRVYHDSKGQPTFEVLSRDTKPPESDARWALLRVLLRMRKEAEKEYLAKYEGLFWALVRLFEPEGFGRSGLLKVIFKKRSQGHSNPFRDRQIAEIVEILKEKGLSYNDATSAVAEELGKSPEHIKKVYGKNRPRDSGRSKAELEKEIERLRNELEKKIEEFFEPD
jgi:hypothetical protein